ncbi:Similar to S.cerevisiae protein SAC1 (Phosphatidylinositol phosphate (PtdInsP) phosphatase) [Malassezia sympodialis ATCC 42132]|uniref:Similar to S.cerevisiae protein SAC1 (Phosphatidylinositol phosphate (PtdInsP) phosphatase) n=1 Tax=Malassezia sympodialis (strain ATCC 42132) TaxID=1230383 RepID=A0A1M8A090_MALS4|nr:Similar to S.cerevisiae protein SAC1 (Phosphatidylinositol phosphate (PtdInsP) phosphatase) [Malassezia sympodialis ATCC 42132]
MSLWSGFTLYVSKDSYTLLPNRSEPGRQAEKLVIDRKASALELQPVVLSDAPPKHDKQFIVHGVLGIISLHTSDFLVVITNRKRVAHILGSTIYLATDFRMLPIQSAANPSLLSHPIEKRLIALVKEALYSGPLYFSYEMDLTSSMQRQVQSAGDEGNVPLWKRADERFFWNRHLQERLIQHTLAHPDQDLSGFIMPVIFGFLQVKLASIHGRSFVLGLIARRSRHRAGTRFFSRGINEEGHVSNFNETEQFVLLDPPSLQQPQDVEDVEGVQRLSFVQTRGSVPVYWAQINNLRYQPDLLIPDDPRAAASFEKHMQAQVAAYGKNYLVNLVNQKGYEKPVKEAYEHAVQVLDHPLLQYTYFDFHNECKGMKFGNVSKLIERLQQQGLSSSDSFSLDTTGAPRLRLQTSVVRTNCMDCLDRTNVVQSILARWVLNEQLRSVGVLPPADMTENYASFQHLFRNMWADHADVISKAYSGTGALKTDFTRTGKRTSEGVLQDGLNSLTRYTKNNFFDGQRQDAFDLITGAWDPRAQTPFVDTRNWMVKLMPWAIYLSAFFVIASRCLPAGDKTRPYYIDTGVVPVFELVWVAVAVSALVYVWQHGLLYVGWPSLNRPEALMFYTGPGYYSGLRGRRGTPNDPYALDQAQRAAKKRQ